jgi:hypothetical protein
MGLFFCAAGGNKKGGETIKSRRLFCAARISGRQAHQ